MSNPIVAQLDAAIVDAGRVRVETDDQRIVDAMDEMIFSLEILRADIESAE